MTGMKMLPTRSRTRMPSSLRAGSTMSLDTFPTQVWLLHSFEQEQSLTPDKDAEKPEEWDDEEDGEWVAPMIRNPKCEEAPGCGEWKR